jgi:hypothetical protein
MKILLLILSLTQLGFNNKTIIEQTLCFSTFNQQLLKLKLHVNEDGYKLYRSETIDNMYSEIRLTSYETIAEAVLSISQQGLTLVESKAYLIPGDFDSVNLSALGFYSSCIYEKQTD